MNGNGTRGKGEGHEIGGEWQWDRGDVNGNGTRRKGEGHEIGGEGWEGGERDRKAVRGRVYMYVWETKKQDIRTCTPHHVHSLNLPMLPGMNTDPCREKDRGLKMIYYIFL